MASSFSQQDSAARLKRYLGAVDAALRANDMEAALRISDEAAGAGLEHPNLLTLAAFKRMRENANDGALALLTRARELSPHSVDVLGALGQCLVRLQRGREALAVYDAALRQAPQSAQLHFNKAIAFEELNELDRARRQFERAIALDPANSEALARLAMLAAQRGDEKSARDYGRRALSRDPRQTAARLALAMADLGDGNFAGAQSHLALLLRDPNIGPVNRAIAQSLAGDVLDGEGRTAEAFAAYAASKSQLHALYAPTFAAVEPARVLVERLANHYRAAPAEVRRTDMDDGSPRTHVFLVGFPRSGTTLLEQILASHPDVQAMEERDALIDAVNDFIAPEDGLARLAALSPAQCAAYRDAYWKRVAEFGQDVSRRLFIDKMPLNTLLLPLVAKFFPDAKILFALRDPRDVVLSCFRRRFGMTGQMYELTTLEGAAAYYAGVMDLAEIYREKLGLDRCETRHETLLADFDGETRRLCDFLGLEWDERMRDFASRAQRGNIGTPSAAQIAGGLSQAGAGQWRRYARELAPVLPVLAPFVARYGYPEN